jgi:hypothetical protein
MISLPLTLVTDHMDASRRVESNNQPDQLDQKGESLNAADNDGRDKQA